MKTSKLAEALNHIDEDLVADVVNDTKKHKKNEWMKWAAMAVCLCVGMMAWQGREPSLSSKPGITVSENGVTIPPMEVDLSGSGHSAASMIGFFIYQGRCYVQYEDIYEDVDLIDEHLGTITGMIDEWTPMDGYVDYAGSATGEFYSVKGYDPTFMLCMKHMDGAIATFICNTGITLKYGSELYEDRMHLSENIAMVQYESRESWYYSRDQLYDLNYDNEAIWEFIRQLNEAEFIPCDAVPLEEGQSSLVNLEEYHLYFRMKNGTTIHLRLHEKGYVRFEGIMDVCLQVPEATYEALVEVLQDGTGTPATYIPDRRGVTLEECRSDLELGAYVPEYTAKATELQTAYIHYYIDPQTGEETGTKEIYLDYMGPEEHYCSYSISITWKAEHEIIGWGGPIIDVSELSMETISKHMKPYERFGQEVSYGGEIHMGVWYGDVMVELNAWGIDEETVLEILKSVE